MLTPKRPRRARSEKCLSACDIIATISETAIQPIAGIYGTLGSVAVPDDE